MILLITTIMFMNAMRMQSDSSIMRLDSAHKAELVGIAELDEHKPGSNTARNVLNFFYDSLFFTPAYLPEQQYNKKGDEDESEKSTSSDTNEAKPQPAVKIYPNPANSTVTIEYSGLSKSNTLYISDMMGWLKEVKVLINTNGKEIINVSGYTNGIYTARIETEDEVLLKGKIVILK